MFRPPQGHGAAAKRPEYLDRRVELIAGDVRNAADVQRALRGADAVVHLAASVGVGQSMYEVAGYTAVNNLGTAVLLEALIQSPVERLVVASSMSIYGEGLYRDARGTPVAGQERTLAQLRAREWKLRGADGEPLRPLPTPETKPPSLASDGLVAGRRGDHAAVDRDLVDTAGRYIAHLRRAESGPGVADPESLLEMVRTNLVELLGDTAARALPRLEAMAARVLGRGRRRRRARPVGARGVAAGGAVP